MPMERAPFGCLPDELPWYMTTLMLKCVTTRSLLPRDWSFIPTALQFHPYGTAVSSLRHCSLSRKGVQGTRGEQRDLGRPHTGLGSARPEAPTRSNLMHRLLTKPLK